MMIFMLKFEEAFVMSDKDVFGISADNVDIDVSLPVANVKSDAERVLEFMSLPKKEREAHLREIELKRKILQDSVVIPSDSSLLRITCRGHNKK